MLAYSKLLFVTLDHETLYLVLERPDLAHQLTGLIGRDRHADDSTGNTTGTSQSSFTRDVAVRHILICPRNQLNILRDDGEYTTHLHTTAGDVG